MFRITTDTRGCSLFLIPCSMLGLQRPLILKAGVVYWVIKHRRDILDIGMVVF